MLGNSGIKCSIVNLKKSGKCNITLAYRPYICSELLMLVSRHCCTVDLSPFTSPIFCCCNPGNTTQTACTYLH